MKVAITVWGNRISPVFDSAQTILLAEIEQGKIISEYEEILERIAELLETHYRDMQDMEFTIEKGKLWMLQTRNGKRTAEAAVRIAVEMVQEGLIDKKTAIMRVEPNQIDQLLHPTFDPKAEKKVVAKGLPASPGAATGRMVFHADDAEEWSEKGEKVILVRIETSPEDLKGMNSAQGILTPGPRVKGPHGG